MVKLLRDPLLLFVVLGGLLAGLYAWTREEAPADLSAREIVVTDADVAWMVQVFQKTRMRPPTPAELAGMVRQRVREEMLYREALAMGLDREDPTLRRRLAMKLEYLAKDAATRVDPTPEELAAHLAANPKRYERGPWRAFTQVYLSPDRHGDDVEAKATTLLERLQSDPRLDATTVGDPSLLEAAWPPSTPVDVERQFGRRFADALFDLEVGTWQGPVASGLGLHLVRIEEAVPAEIPPLAAVEDRVRADLLTERRDTAFAAYLEGLSEKYGVTLDLAPPDDEAK